MNQIKVPSDLGSLVQQARKQAGMRQADAAALCGVGVRFLSDLENGKETAHIGKTLQVLRGLGIRLHASVAGDRQVDSRVAAYRSPASPRVEISEQSDLEVHKQDLRLHQYRGNAVIDSFVRNAHELAGLSLHPAVAGIDDVLAESKRMQQILRRDAEKLASAGIYDQARKIAMDQEKQIKTLTNLVAGTASSDARQLADPVKRFADSTNRLTDLLGLSPPLVDPPKQAD